MNGKIIRHGKFEFEIDFPNTCCIAVKGHNRIYSDKRAFAYVVYAHFIKDQPIIWGYGCEANTETAYLYAIDAVFSRLFAIDESEEPTIEAFVLADGFANNVRSYVPAWRRKEAEAKKKGKNFREPNAYAQNCRVYDLISLCRLVVTRTTPERSFPEMSDAKVAVGKLVEYAFAQGAHLKLGLVNEGDTRSFADVPAV